MGMTVAGRWDATLVVGESEEQHRPGRNRGGCLCLGEKRWRTLSLTHKSGRHFGQSQRDCDLQPRVVSLRATLGVRGPRRFNPNGVAAFRPAHGHNPVGVGCMVAGFPRVARPSQPWALGQNPVGIQRISPRLVGNDKGGPPHSRTLARTPTPPILAKRPGVRQSSGAFDSHARPSRRE